MNRPCRVYLYDMFTSINGVQQCRLSRLNDTPSCLGHYTSPLLRVSVRHHSSIVDIFIDHRQLPNRASAIKRCRYNEPHPTRPTYCSSELVRSKGGHLEINKDRSPPCVLHETGRSRWSTLRFLPSFSRLQPFTVNTRGWRLNAIGLSGYAYHRFFPAAPTIPIAKQPAINSGRACRFFSFSRQTRQCSSSLHCRVL